MAHAMASRSRSLREQIAEHCANVDSITVSGEGTAEALRSCPEFTLSVLKRFRNSLVSGGACTYSDLVVWCLCVDGYHLCHRSFPTFTDEDIEAAWSFVDTASVSSSEPLRSLIDVLLAGRSGDGFRFSTQTRGYRDYVPRQRYKHKLTNPKLIEYAQGSYANIEELMVEDCIEYALSSADPTETVLSMYKKTSSVP